MMLTFNNLITLIADNFFDGSTTLASLAIIVALWAVAAIICINARASPSYSVVVLIPISLFFVAYGTLPSTIMIIIVLVASALVAAEFKKVVD